jgi:hypothetical protein
VLWRARKLRLRRLVVAVDDELHPEIGWRYSSPGHAGFSKEARHAHAFPTDVVGRAGLPYRDLGLRQFQQGQFATRVINVIDIVKAEHRCRHRRRSGRKSQTLRLPTRMDFGASVTGCVDCSHR